MNYLPGREQTILPHPRPHLVFDRPLLAAPGEGECVIYLASGCFWGAEKVMWQLPVETTAVGYMGGVTPNPTYEEVCTSLTGHAETVRVVYNPSRISTAEILRAYFESHDPTSLNRQGGDRGTQYRSAIFADTDEQARTAQTMIEGYQPVLTAAGLGPIVTTIQMTRDVSPFYPAEDYHQQYLIKNPGGYECHAETGLPCPMPGASPLASLPSTADAQTASGASAATIVASLPSAEGIVTL